MFILVEKNCQRFEMRFQLQSVKEKSFSKSHSTSDSDAFVPSRFRTLPGWPAESKCSILDCRFRCLSAKKFSADYLTLSARQLMGKKRWIKISKNVPFTAKLRPSKNSASKPKFLKLESKQLTFWLLSSKEAKSDFSEAPASAKRFSFRNSFVMSPPNTAATRFSPEQESAYAKETTF